MEFTIEKIDKTNYAMKEWEIMREKKGKQS